MPEKTFIMIKPDHVELADDILEHLDQHGNRIDTSQVDEVPRDVIEAHYSPHKDKPFFGNMTDSFVGRSVILAVYEGEGVIQRLMDIIGPTDPSKAPQDTVRGMYSDDSLEKAIAEQRPVKNVIHRSDSPEESAREIDVWKQYLSQ
jgi:nucleoside-diphosphate kinase